MSEESTMTAPAPASHVQPPAQQQANYWGFNATDKFFFPDGITFIEHKVMNEGDKVRFQKATGRDITLSRQGDAKLKLDAGAERHTLIKTVIVSWNLIRDDGMGNPEPVPCDDRNQNAWLSVADPRIVEDLEVAIRKANPWLIGELTVEELEKQKEEIEELLVAARAREAGEGSSVSR